MRREQRTCEQRTRDQIYVTTALSNEPGTLINRRHMLQWAATVSVPAVVLGAQAQPAVNPMPDVEAMLRAGGCAVVLRHAQTEPGVGDPPGFRLGQCSTQRNLSDAGREQAALIGRWFSSRSLKPSSLWSSPWCRCKDTAAALGPYQVLAALASTFEGKSNALAQTAALHKRLATIKPLQFEVWVTHQVNITALSGEGAAMGAAMGEAVVLKAGGSSGSGGFGAPMILASVTFR